MWYCSFEYAKYGCIEVALQLFNKMYGRDLVSWSAMIIGHASLVEDGSCNKGFIKETIPRSS